MHPILQISNIFIDFKENYKASNALHYIVERNSCTCTFNMN